MDELHPKAGVAPVVTVAVAVVVVVILSIITRLRLTH
jgi:hypothetical protein